MGAELKALVKIADCDGDPGIAATLAPHMSACDRMSALCQTQTWPMIAIEDRSGKPSIVFAAE